MMKQRILLTFLLALAVCLPLVAQAQLNISIGDQGYYNHGDYYYDNGYRYVWVPGHWGSHHHWVHGHYVRRGHDHEHVGVGVDVGGIHIH